ILRVETRPMTPLDVGPAPRWRAGAVRDEALGAGMPAAERDDRRDAGAYGRNALWPSVPLRLGTIGYLRDQRFVEVYYTPLLYNPARGAGVFYSRIEAEVRFSATPDPAATASVDPYFEDTYASSLVNYDQGKRFRTGPAAPRGKGRAGIEAAGPV